MSFASLFDLSVKISRAMANNPAVVSPLLPRHQMHKPFPSDYRVGILGFDKNKLRRAVGKVPTPVRSGTRVFLYCRR